MGWISALENATGIVFDAERARRDSSYNNVVIEFKGPGLFNGSKASAKFIEATERRLLPYIQRIAVKERADTENYIGIAIDGDHVCFAQVVAGEIKTQHLIPFSLYAVELVIQAVTAQTRKAISSDNLMRDFGHGSQGARGLMQGLADALATRITAPGNNKIKMLFEEWKTLYGQVADMSFLQADEIERELSFVWNGPAGLSIPARLFVVHTYNSLIIKLLAAEIVSGHGLTATSQPAQEMAAVADDAGLLRRLENDIEGSGLFTQAGIVGFVEEVIFSWYLDPAQDAAIAPSILQPLRRILTSLSLYRTDRMTHTRDVLRDLYQGLVPGRLRHSLGEYYTPDWLVDHTITRAKNGPWLQKRVLDPTCGSGSFLIAAIRIMKSEAAAAGQSSADTLDGIVHAVWGFDLNPLAVQTARVNYLMEIADLLRAAPGHRIEVPVLLADAIYAPTVEPAAGQDVVEYRIGSMVARLNITLPAALVRDRRRLDHFFDQMGRDVEALRDFDACSRRIIAAGLATSHEMTHWDAPLRATYDQVLNLHHMQWNGIWFRIVRNFFWSASAGRFDYVIGNPPWVRWSKLPEAYRQRVKPTCEHYGIFSRTKRHGGNELDISAMIAYTVADKWLADDGRMTLVITGTIFKNPSSEGFRTFQIEPQNEHSKHLVPRLVDDMRRLKPFNDAVNHTTVVVFDKENAPGIYPIPYAEWGAAAGFARAIPAEASLADVFARVEIKDMEAAPVGELGSPWAVLEPGRFAVLNAMSGKCHWVAGRKGITADLNGVYFVRPLSSNGDLIEVQSRPEAGRKDIGAPRTAWVENEFLYPLLKGAGDFERFYLKLSAPGAAPLLTFVPNEGINGDDYETADLEMSSPRLARTRAWFDHYRPLLEQRSTYRRQMQGAPHFAIYNVGTYTFAPWKVIWPEMSTRFFAAVAGSATVPGAGMRPFVPDHKIYFAAFNDPEPAYFLCALLNAPIVCEWIESHIVSIQVGDVFKHLSIPEFDPADPRHIRLAELSEQAHHTHNAAARAATVDQIGQIADAVLKAWVERQ
ncbi:N-6 DNA methylase [Palleronia sp.]|uniref:N-6 DNA methylase n=1 Tax=Palleronia sp. TaxID=1940284 RepID=UPI0035C85F0D